MEKIKTIRKKWSPFSKQGRLGPIPPPPRYTTGFLIQFLEKCIGQTVILDSLYYDLLYSSFDAVNMKNIGSRLICEKFVANG